MPRAKDVHLALGRSPDGLSLEERIAIAGKFVALEVYSPATTPLRRIEAVGDSIDACIRQLGSRGLDPAQFEFSQMPAPYQF